MKIITFLMTGVIFTVGLSGSVFAQETWMSENQMKAPAIAMEPKSDHGTYSEYTKAGFDAAKDMKRVLFFAASWCPTCMATDKALKEQVTSIPAGVEVFKTDYNTSKHLKEQYAVTHMDTFVQVDNKGVRIARWNGGGVEGIAKNLK